MLYVAMWLNELNRKFRLVMILGSLARHSTLISQDLDLSEVIKNTYITTSDKHNGIPPHQVDYDIKY